MNPAWCDQVFSGEIIKDRELLVNPHSQWRSQDFSTGGGGGGGQNTEGRVGRFLLCVCVSKLHFCTLNVIVGEG